MKDTHRSRTLTRVNQRLQITCGIAYTTHLCNSIAINRSTDLHGSSSSWSILITRVCLLHRDGSLQEDGWRSNSVLSADDLRRWIQWLRFPVHCPSSMCDWKLAKISRETYPTSLWMLSRSREKWKSDRNTDASESSVKLWTNIWKRETDLSLSQRSLFRHDDIFNWLWSCCWLRFSSPLRPLRHSIGEFHPMKPMRNKSVMIRIDHLLTNECDNDTDRTSNDANWKVTASACQSVEVISMWTTKANQSLAFNRWQRARCLFYSFAAFLVFISIKANNREREEWNSTVTIDEISAIVAWQQDQSPCWSAHTGDCISFAVSKRKNKEVNQTLSITERGSMFSHALINSVVWQSEREPILVTDSSWQMIVRNKHAPTRRIINRLYFLFQKIFAGR